MNFQGNFFNFIHNSREDFRFKFNFKDEKSKILLYVRMFAVRFAEWKASKCLQFSTRSLFEAFQSAALWHNQHFFCSNNLASSFLPLSSYPGILIVELSFYPSHLKITWKFYGKMRKFNLFLMLQATFIIQLHMQTKKVLREISWSISKSNLVVIFIITFIRLGIKLSKWNNTCWLNLARLNFVVPWNSLLFVVWFSNKNSLNNFVFFRWTQVWI